MRDATHNAITAILDTDPTIPNPDRLIILHTCKNPRVKMRGKKVIPMLLTFQQVVQIFQMSTRTIRRMYGSGLLHGIRFSGKSIRFRAEELERVIKVLTVGKGLSVQSKSPTKE